MADNKKPFHETVAEKLIAQLKAGTAPWQTPWEPGEPHAYLPMNPTTGKRYKGINLLYLMSQDRGDPRWLTYRQASMLSAQVRKGEKGTPIQYWNFTQEQDKLDERGQLVLDANNVPVKETIRLERPRVFFATVFNAEQIDDLPPMPRKESTWDVIERAENILISSGATLRHGEKNHAFYRPATDSIHLPDKGQFRSADRYFATVLHELGHWSGHPSRLDRDLSHPFGSEGYAREELRAEIASMILGNELGIGHDPEQHVAYIGSWIKALQEDPLEIFRAAAAAEKIYDYVLSFEQQRIHEQSTEQITASLTQLQGHTLEVNMEREEQHIAEALKAVEGDKPERRYITVPYNAKEEAKALGARWDRQQQSWFVPQGIDLASFAKWEPETVSLQGEGQKMARERLYLTVSYGERVAAKAVGALWDKAAKSWYVDSKADREKLKRWLPDNVLNQQAPAMNPKEEFTEALLSLNCIVTNEHPIMDGKTHRIFVEGDKKGEPAGFYVGHLDGHPAGYIKNNRTGIEMKWKSKGYTLDPQEKAKLQIEAAAKRTERVAEQTRLYEATAQRVCAQMKNLVPVTEQTPYLGDKGIQAHTGVLTDSEGQKTYIPAYDENGKQWTLQTIQEDGTKRFAKNSRKEGCFHPVGGFDALAAAPVLVIAEGYATAASLAEALGQATVAAFDSGNLPPVAKVLQAKYPDKPIIIAGDNDQHLEATQGINPGKMKAEEAAKAVGGNVILPIFAPGEQTTNPKGFTDFNDLANKSVLGREGIERQVRSVVSMVLLKDHQQQNSQHRRTVKIQSR